MSEITTIKLSAAEARIEPHLDADTPYLIGLFPIHALVWTVAAWLANGNLDTQGDMIENYVWGIEWQAGYIKHPPLFAWITAAWFRVFPHVDIAYFALSALNAMTGLLGVVALAGRFLPNRLAVVAGFAMGLTPLYSNLAIKFNANAVLLSVWPWTAYCFIRFMQTGGWKSALTLGVLAATAVLGKYFSIVLLIALLLAALVRPTWRKRLLDRRALLVVVTGLVVLTPHIHWLVVNHFPTFHYAEEGIGGTLPAAVARFGIYTLAQCAYLLPAFGFVVLLVRKRRGEAARLMATRCFTPSWFPDLWWLVFGPLIAVGAIVIVAKAQMASVWGMAEWFAIVPLWLAALDRYGIDLVFPRISRILVVYWAIVLGVTATVGYIGMLRQTDNAAAPLTELARVANTLWRDRTGQDVPIVAGSEHEAQSIAFYSKGRTRYWSVAQPGATPWLTVADIREHGALFVCRSDDAACLSASASLSGVKPVSVKVGKRTWGRLLPARSYEMFVSAPTVQR